MSTLKESMDASQAILRTVKELQNGTGFGSIEITLHEGRITQIEKREKFRFTKDNKEIKTSTTLHENNRVATRKII
jgi:hypothetical protein